MEERLTKQNFLSEEIIQKGFDADVFMNFCESIKGTEIDDYSLDELKDIVKSFQDSQKKGESIEPNSRTHSSLQNELVDPPRDSSPESPEITVPETKVDQPVSKPSKDSMKRNENSAYSIEAIKMQDNDLSLEEFISVSLKAVESVSQGLLSSTKYFYPVETKPFDWTVKRTIEDFIWLRQVLSTNFSGVYLPPFPPKRFKSTSDASSKQQYFLERFINCIVRNPLLRRSTYLQSFLSDADNKVFAEVKKRSNKEKKAGKLEDFWTLDGTIICDPFNDESEKVTISEYLNVVEAMKKKIKRQSDTVISAFKDLSNQILDIAKSYEILENVQSFMPEVRTTQITGTKPLYNSLKNSFLAWAEHEHKCADLLQDHFNMFFKYGYNEIIPLKELIREKDVKFECFERAKSRLLAKKEKLWTAGDVNKWGLSNEDMWNASVLKGDKILAFGKMLRGESCEVEKLKDEFAYFNFQARSELRRFLLDNQLLENLHFTNFARAMCNQTTNIHVGWGELIASLSRIRSENIPSRSFISKKQ